jgi:site-specific DNA-methyltransferase (adenine-specific)
VTLDIFTTQPAALYFGDAREILPRLPAASVACVATDFPYWTLDEHRRVGTTTRLKGHRDPAKRRGWFDTLGPDDLLFCFREFYRLLPRSGHAWVMSDRKTLKDALASGEEAGFKVWPFPVFKLTNDQASFRQGMGYHGRGTHEYVVLAEKGRRKFPTNDQRDFFEFPWTGGEESRRWTPDGGRYPTAKPLALFRRFVQLSTLPGERVQDAFAGSGVCLHAALREGRDCVSVEKGEYGYLTAERRLKEVSEALWEAVDGEDSTGLPRVRGRDVRPADHGDGHSLLRGRGEHGV